MQVKTSRRLPTRVALSAIAATLLFAGTANAATVTVGSPLTATFTQTPASTEPGTFTNFVLPSPANATSPTDGTVINWRFIGETGSFAPRVLRSTGGTSHTAVATGVPMPAAVPPAISGPFTTSLPIKRGDRIGIDAPTASTLGVATTTGATYLTWAPPLADGAAGRAPTSSVASEVAISATIRFCRVPNLKGMTGAAARQALTAANCTIGVATKSSVRKPFKQVLKQAQKANSSIADTTPVDFTVSQKLKPRVAKPGNKCKKIRNKKKRKRCNKKRRARR